MAETKRRTGLNRSRDAQHARETILAAAEAAFAERGYDGARMDAIARAAGYNISLVFQYFGDKLGLYGAVLERAQRETGELQGRVLAPLLADQKIVLRRAAFRAFLAGAAGTVFDYLDQHPRLLRILTWEMAGGWQTYARLAERFPPDPAGRFETPFAQARQAGWLRTDWPASIQLTLIFQVSQSYLAFRPLYQALRPAAADRARERERVVAFVVGGLLSDGPPPRRRKGGLP